MLEGALPKEKYTQRKVLEKVKISKIETKPLLTAPDTFAYAIVPGAMQKPWTLYMTVHVCARVLSERACYAA